MHAHSCETLVVRFSNLRYGPLFVSFFMGETIFLQLLFTKETLSGNLAELLLSFSSLSLDLLDLVALK